MNSSVRKYGKAPYTIALLHGGPGAAGEMRSVAMALSKDFGVLEFLQTGCSVDAQVEEVREQVTTSVNGTLTLIGYSWGAWLAVLFAGKYPRLVKKLILIGAGAFDIRYNPDMMKIRLSRLTPGEKAEVRKTLTLMGKAQTTPALFARFGKLMEKADAYDLIARTDKDAVQPDENIYLKVWEEAEKLRESGELLQSVEKIDCPVIAFHGLHDPHPVAGVEIPLSERLHDFTMITLEKCGHTPWNEKYAVEEFYKKLKEAIKE